MQLTDEKSDTLKSWVVKRLENISDADPEVLGDYVLALLKSDAPGDEIRKNSIQNLEDFLRDHTTPFINELFAKFLPTFAPLPPPVSSTGTLPGLNISATQSNPPLPIQAYDPTSPLDLSNKQVNTFNANRKRPRNEPGDAASGREPYYNGKTRTLKAPRGPRTTRDERFSRRNGHNRSPDPIVQGFGPPNNLQLPIPPIQPPELSSLNPNDFMGSLMAMQALMPNFQGTWDAATQERAFGAKLPPRISRRCKDYDTKGYCARGSSCPYEHGTDHIVAPGATDEYDPTNAFIDVPKGINGHSTRGFYTRGRSTHRGTRGRGKQGDNESRRDSRADYSDPRPNFDRSVTTIVVEQIPEGNFQESTVRDFFSQHGTVIDVTMKPYKRLALVKYNDWSSAKRAYESPKVIFDNRFVKVYWYKPTEQNLPNNVSIKGRAESSQSPSSPTSARTDGDKNHEDVLLRQAEAQKNYEAKAKARKEMAEARKALQHQQEEVVKKHEAEKAELLAKIVAKEASKKGSPSSKAEKPDDKVNQSLREQLAKLEAEAVSLGLDPNAPAEESYNISGNYRGRGRGRGFYTPTRFPTRGRGSYRGSYRGGWTAPRGGGVMRLDNRPKRVAVKVSEWTAERDEALRQYLLTLGPFESIERDPAHSDLQVISFHERYMAEQLMHGTSQIPGVGKVEMSWVAGPTPSGSSAGAGHVRNHSDGDVVMGTHSAGGHEDGQGENKATEGASKEAHHEVEYDVAEEDDWGIE